jgi:hypothetical protein
MFVHQSQEIEAIHMNSYTIDIGIGGEYSV